jgi:hypothetical protein
MMLLYIWISYKIWISTPRPASVYYAGRGRIGKLHMCISLFHRAFQFTKYNGPTNALVYNKTLI